uniref:Uncharacterized protein n=1 Tax=Rhizobium leguminosarum bv. viciae TaxID=387 RepID=A0A0U3JJD0_RHILV|nr:hypothetical protein [Rhizobium leguminosarum bv. viciae]
MSMGPRRHSEDDETLGSDMLHDYLGGLVIRNPLHSRRS